MNIFDIKIPYWIGKRLGITLYKTSNGVLRLGLWKYERFGKEYGGHKGEWGFNIWKFIDIGRGK